MKLTQERLKCILNYNPETGVFTRKIRTSNSVRIGDVAGFLNMEGYWRIKVDSKPYPAHRLAFLYMEGYIPENDVDHIDRDRANNKWNNLREVSRSCNMRNCNIAKNNKSGITGVTWNKAANKWVVRITTPKKIFLGRFSDITNAARARWEAEVKYGFPNCNTTSSAYNYLKEKGAI